MNLGKYIKDVIKNQGRTIAWVADQLDMNERTFAGKLNRDSISGEDLIRISHLLGFNLEQLKEEMINMKSTAELSIGEMKEICEEFNYSMDQLHRMNFIVTDKCELLIVLFETVDLSKQTKILKMNSIFPTVRYSGSYLTGIATPYKAANLEDHMFIDGFLANATKGITNSDCIKKIIQDGQFLELV